MQERQLAGENASVDRAPRASAPKSKEKPPVGLGIAPDEDAATLPGGRPSPFGPKDGDDAAKPADTGSVGSGKTDAPAAAPAAAPATAKPDSAAPAGEEPAALPGGRPSPFGPRN